MLVKTYCAAVNGLEVTTVTIEVSMNPGVVYHLTGLGDKAVQEVATASLQPFYTAVSSFLKPISPSIWLPPTSRKRAAALICRWR